jgi:demethylmenaquinone methyltransferase / 2-methoxy-6-polyprenyl-1,4-benzoquinol methylase
LEYTKDPKFIGRMFDEISPTYVKLNHIFSGMQDIRWRKRAVRYLKSKQPEYKMILDLAAGTGDFAREFLNLNPDKIYSCDLSEGMLKINKEKVNSPRNIIVQANAEFLPFEDNMFDLVGIAFGVRNFENLPACIKEINRVLKPGGRFVTIEMFRNVKNGIVQKSFKYYFRNILPKIGNLLSHSNYAYNYLFQSVDSFLSINEYKELIESLGFETEYVKNEFIGIVHTAVAIKSA